MPLRSCTDFSIQALDHARHGARPALTLGVKAMAHRVEFLVIAAEFTRAVTTGCDLGAQREHQHTDGGQPHKDAPVGKRRGEEKASGLAFLWTRR